MYGYSQTGKEWHKYKLTQEQVDSYWTNGYLPNIRVLSEDQCDKLLEDYKVFLVSGVFVCSMYVCSVCVCASVVIRAYMHPIIYT